MGFNLNDLARIGKEIDGINEAAFSLWSWLPSRAEAEKHHGDCADEKNPGPEAVMREMCQVLGIQEYPNTVHSRIEADKAIEWFSCPCREHDLTREEAAALLAKIRAGR